MCKKLIKNNENRRSAQGSPPFAHMRIQNPSQTLPTNCQAGFTGLKPGGGGVDARGQIACQNRAACAVNQLPLGAQVRGLSQLCSACGDTVITAESLGKSVWADQKTQKGEQ